MKKILLALFALLLFSGAAFAQYDEFFGEEADDDMLSLEDFEEDELWDSIWGAAIEGPDEADLGGLGSIDIPAGMLFLPKEEAVLYSEEYLGNTDESDLVGLLVAVDEETYWVAYIMYFEDGHYSDKYIEDWDFDAMLRSYQTGTAEDNLLREEYGFSTLSVLGWKDEPIYEEDTNVLRFSFDMLSGDEPLINYNVYKLGRRGYFEILFATSDYEGEKAYADEIIANVEFYPEFSYAAYDPRVDGDQFDLAGLITGAKEVVKDGNGMLLIGVIAAPILIGIAVALIYARRRNGGGGNKPRGGTPISY